VLKVVITLDIPPLLSPLQTRQLMLLSAMRASSNFLELLLGGNISAAVEAVVSQSTKVKVNTTPTSPTRMPSGLRNGISDAKGAILNFLSGLTNSVARLGKED
jgi:hypothetical protein